VLRLRKVSRWRQPCRLRRLGHRRRRSRRRPGEHPADQAYDEKFGLVKVNPIAGMSDEAMQAYIREHGVWSTRWSRRAYPRIGVRPVHRQARCPARNPRSGRWAGTGKIECGLHQTWTVTVQAPVPTPWTRWSPRRIHIFREVAVEFDRR
jgi:3'-phosphoadenosine 5'-phosphosulfate sulfotransferase (PAPS reductase)/FAD synthetase